MDIGDASAVAALTQELGYEATMSDVRSRSGVLGADSDHALFVAEDRGKVIGWIHIHRACAIQAPDWGEIGGLVVAAGRHRGGVGRALIAAAEAWAEQHGLGTIRVRSRERRRDAHRFYESLGYGIVKTSLTFEKQLPG